MYLGVVFRQGSANTDYLLHLYDLFKEYTLKSPSIYNIKDKKSNKVRSNLSFTTLALPCFNEYYDLFYKDGIKRIPTDIDRYLTKMSLAYWIMDDGGFTGNGLKLYTNAYNLEEINILIQALNKNFSLKASVNKTSIKDQYTIYIPKSQMPLIVTLVKEYMHPIMLYKINL